jgi:signal transduction histidine kinase
MIGSIILLVVGLVALATVSIVTFVILRQKNRIILLQEKEIEKQFQELARQRKELEDLINQNKQMIGVVSHDLKGPFNRIFALVQLMSLSAETLSPDQHEYLDKIHQIVADGLGMVRNLLDNRRLEEKGIEFLNERLNLTTLLGSLVKNYHVLGAKKTVQFHFQAPTQAIVVADKLYLTRVFENLLSNALKFSQPNRNVFVFLEDNDHNVVISVRDEGPGISVKDQSKLYHKLQRLSARPTGGESSTGLGLWIVKTILEKMDGEIDCTSNEAGTTFAVTLKKKLVE